MPEINSADFQEPWRCLRCAGQKWVSWCDLPNYDGPAIQTGIDDTKYPCPECAEEESEVEAPLPSFSQLQANMKALRALDPEGMCCLVPTLAFVREVERHAEGVSAADDTDLYHKGLYPEADTSYTVKLDTSMGGDLLRIHKHNDLFSLFFRLSSPDTQAGKVWINPMYLDNLVNRFHAQGCSFKVEPDPDQGGKEVLIVKLHECAIRYQHDPVYLAFANMLGANLSSAKTRHGQSTKSK